MPIERSAGIIVFRKEKEKIFYLFLHYVSRSKPKNYYWDFPKGHIEKGENAIAAAKREVKEETYITDIRLLEGFNKTIKYFFRAEGNVIFKTVTFYLAETKEKEIKISEEHIGYKWASYKEALKLIKHKNTRELLKKANQFLNENIQRKSLFNNQKNTKRKGFNL